ncbi:aldehyde dehydrogenase family protein [Mycobacterium sp. 21AC1]|uniref:aldehyde dehydrogenase family protein n=1 Tax=[Mycobacterium] appelbergii TaxID=2939269 RepID=UPI002938EC3F|nr:aldehyde dehydrogenase family protein [Mycobacterium sp. 21AC1]MDV3125437.1 aldehyde dehydrogenase family protein [Mycobacterium sp. 21AC1]
MTVDNISSGTVHGNRIGGTTVTTTRTQPVINPATGERIGEVPLSESADVDAAVQAARSAQPGWAALAPQQRAEILARWADLLADNREDLAATATAEMGKLIKESLGEVDRAIAEIRFMGGEALRADGQTFPSTRSGTLVYTTRVPVGTVAAITPWNFPIVSPVRKIAPALAVGDAVVVKPAEQSPLSALLLIDLLLEAGLPAGVVNVVCGSGAEIGDVLVAHPGIDAISFTGSTAIGRRISRSAGERLIPVQLELGGKNAAYVDADADLDRAVAEIVSASIQATGQRCTAISRVVAHESIADELTARIAAEYDALSVGPGTDSVDVGPLVSESARDKVVNYVEGAIAAGAVAATSGRQTPDGPYLAPTVLDHVRPEMTVAREEVFGPVLSVIRVPDAATAIKVANESEYGLAGCIFTKDLAAALAFAEQLDTGMVHVNHGTASQPHVPFGGVRASGLGAYSIGHVAQDFFTKLKVVYVAA